ncbi:MAG: hypothetical protein JOZ65_12695 [Chloroflexi bacterium]|nr:hypothetical protein [Chloroflexota bacterium]
MSDVQAAPDGRIDCTQPVLRVLDWLGVYVLVPIGGDDTLSYAERLSVENVEWLAFPRPWTTTCTARTTAWASQRP